MSVVFFTDRDLGLKFPSILREAGVLVERHADHFAPTAGDEEWLELTAKKKWVAITHDSRIRYKPNELAAVIAHKAALLVVVGAAPFPELAHNFVATLPRVFAFVAGHERPFIAKVYRPMIAGDKPSKGAMGHVALWYPPSHT